MMPFLSWNSVCTGRDRPDVNRRITPRDRYDAHPIAKIVHFRYRAIQQPRHLERR